MRRRDRELTAEQAFQAIDASPWCVVSMIDSQGNPYCATVNAVRDGQRIYFHCATEGFKVDCLRANPRVCLSFVAAGESIPGKLTMAYRSAIARGQAHEITDADEKTRALALLTERFDPVSLPRLKAVLEKSLNRTAVWRIDVTDVSGKANPGD